MYFLPCGLLAVWGHRKKGLICREIWLPAVIGGWVGALSGVLLAGWLPGELLRKGFGLLVLALGLRELLRKQM